VEPPLYLPKGLTQGQMDTQTSMTAPSDKVNAPHTTTPKPPLTEGQVQEAFNELVVSDYIPKFPRVERQFCDPLYSNQVYCLHSFVPSKGATPDKDGIYGMVKCRGTFASVEEANSRAEYLIRNVDSYHQVYTGYVGKPFPFSINNKYVKETKEVDIKKKMADVINEDVKTKREEEKKEIETIQQRETNLKQEIEQESAPEEVYTTLRVKRAQLIWTYVNTKKKLDEMKAVLKRTEKEIVGYDRQYPSYKKLYYDKFMEARRKAGFPEDDDSFVKYMASDFDLDIDRL